MEESVKTLTNMSDLQQIMHAFRLEKQDYRSFSALTLAYIGDCVFDLVIRSVVVLRSHKQVNDLHKKTTRFVKAETQAVIIQGLLDNDMLTEEEKAVYKRGRNTKSHTVAKNASVAAYRKATGFEALLGYLYITGQMERILELTQAGISYTDLTL
ncbi:MAG: ribonuclease III [Lachnospiraceae bacterium]|nr:ribonuclease III [Lachnospiraceae bacterium]